MSAARRVELLTAVGQALYGQNWHLPLARRYGFDPRNLRRWANGKREMTREEVEKLYDHALRDSARLTSAVADLSRHLLSSERP